MWHNTSPPGEGFRDCAIRGSSGPGYDAPCLGQVELGLCRPTSPDFLPRFIAVRTVPRAGSTAVVLHLVPVPVPAPRVSIELLEMYQCWLVELRLGSPLWRTGYGMGENNTYHGDFGPVAYPCQRVCYAPETRTVVALEHKWETKRRRAGGRNGREFFLGRGKKGSQGGGTSPNMWCWGKEMISSYRS